MVLQVKVNVLSLDMSDSVNINILDIGKIIPSIIKYKDSNILGFNKTEKKKNTNYLIT